MFLALPHFSVYYFTCLDFRNSLSLRVFEFLILNFVYIYLNIDIHFTIFTVRYSLYAISTQVRYSLYDIHFTIFTLRYIHFTIYSLYDIHFTIFTLRYIHFTIFTLRYIHFMTYSRYDIHCTIYSLYDSHFTIVTVRYSLHDIHCTIFNTDFLNSKLFYITKCVKSR